MKRRHFIFILFVILTIFLCWKGVEIYRNYIYEKNFTYNQKEEPYSRKLPLNEMDFEVYAEYFPEATALGLNCVKVIKLPCDVDYYLTPEDAEPALTIEKGSLVNVIPDNADRFSNIGYGLRCWPDYVSGWRYGSPFLLGDAPADLNKPAMYYVKSSQLEKVAKAFYETNKKTFSNYTESAFTSKMVGYIDEILYRNGVFCAPK